MITKLNQCLCCDSRDLFTVLDLDQQPLANSYVRAKNDAEDRYPLGLNYCKSCTHLQLTNAVNPDLLFKDYLYVSGTTKTLREYFDNFASNTSSKHASPILDVLDIACNDGSQLDSYKRLGHNTYGIDPAVNLYETSSKNHNIVCDYLSTESISSFNTKFDIIVAQNVFAHNTYPKAFLDICKAYLKTGGKIFIQTSQADMVKHSQFDTVYHEHISFFNIRSMVALLKQVGLYLESVERPSIHGTSYLFVIGNDSREDNSDYLCTTEPYQDSFLVERFSANAARTVKELSNAVANGKSNGYLVVGYGAAAKGNTVLNFGKIELDYIVDDNPLKQGLFTPGMQIPIVPFEYLASSPEPILWIPLSWNFFAEIKQNIESKRADEQDLFYLINFNNNENN